MNLIHDSEDRKYHWSGIYRAKCIDTVDVRKQARIRVWIPDLMPEIDDTKGIWARPANNPLGGRNMTENEAGDDHHYQGSCMIPPTGSWLYIFFENGDPSEPRYFAACDIATTEGEINDPSVPAECRVGSEYWKKWIPIKTRKGRILIFSDDADDERVEITGKKRFLDKTNTKYYEEDAPPDADDYSCKEIDKNQTTVLLDERNGKEKLLIRTWKGDFLHIDIDERMLQAYFENDIRLETNGSFHLKVKGDMNVEVEQEEKRAVGASRHITVGKDQYHSIVNDDHHVVGNNQNIKTENGEMNRQCSTNHNIRTVQGSVNRYVALEHNITSGGDINQYTAANHNIYTNLNMNRVAGGSHYICTVGNQMRTLAGSHMIKAGATIDRIAAQTYNIKTEQGTINFKGGGNINGDAPQIWWNSGKSEDAAEAQDGIQAKNITIDGRIYSGSKPPETKRPIGDRDT